MKPESSSSLSGSEEDEMRFNEAACHVARARHLLTGLCGELGGRHKWPELDEAMTNLEVALSILTTESSEML